MVNSVSDCFLSIVHLHKSIFGCKYRLYVKTDVIDLQYRISNIRYNVSSGDRYPVPDKSAPVYVTVGDGGNQEGLAGR